MADIYIYNGTNALHTRAFIPLQYHEHINYVSIIIMYTVII